MARTTAQLRRPSTFRGRRVSTAQRITFEAAAAAGIPFTLNDGQRTVAIQRLRVEAHGLWSPSNPTGAAAPNPDAPHVKRGRANHADDLQTDGGHVRVAAFYSRRGIPVAFNVSTERWHMDVLSEPALLAAARRLDVPADPFAAYPADERRWLHEYDRLKAGDRDVGRRIVLRRYMTARRKSIWRAAQESGWEKLNRRARYASLLART